LQHGKKLLARAKPHKLTMPTNYDQLPEELRWTPQWCIAGKDDAGKYKVPNQLTPKGLRKADPTQPANWNDFETIRDYAENNMPHGLGFVLAATDPYVCIDLDVKNQHNEPDQSKWTSPQNLERFHTLITRFHSYTERSSGGQGYHIWLRGHTGKGARRDGVEVYSQERFIVCTGDTIIDVPIAENQDLLDALMVEMRRGEAPALMLVDNLQTEDDHTILNRAAGAANSDKFLGLWQGDWGMLKYPSQSEADISLLTMLAFYTKSNTQVLRLFRLSGLGKREKAVKNDYYLLTTLKKVRSIAAQEESDSQVGEKIAKALFLKLASQQARPAPSMPPAPAAWPPTNLLPPAGAQQPPAPPAQPTAPPRRGNIHALNIPKLHNPLEKQEGMDLPPLQAMSDLQYPPGLVGEIARHIYNTSPRSIREVAIVAALGLMAGFCGKAFNIPQSGLNLYVILVGDSAIGKEAMHSGISGIIRKLAESCPSCTKYVDFADYVSAPALTKAMAVQPCFLNISGEFGKRLQRMASDERGDTTIQQLRTVMTNLYQKSGPGSVFGGLGYSDKEKNVASVSGVAYSMIGETTPDTFYNALTDTMMADGFLSRFTIVEFSGLRPRQSEDFDYEIGEELVNKLTAIVLTADQMTGLNSRSTLVQPDGDALAFLKAFDIKCDDEINSTRDQGWRQMWNRAHLKVYRIAAILAAADNCLFPVIGLEQVVWAYDLVMRDINILTRRIKSGEVGISDATRENKLLDLCKKYLTANLAPSQGIPVAMQIAGIIPRKFFQVNTQRITSFTAHKLGQVTAMDLTIKSLLDGGYLVEAPKSELIQKYEYHGRGFRILNISMSRDEINEVEEYRQKVSAK
jgi:hypothetical protein